MPNQQLPSSEPAKSSPSPRTISPNNQIAQRSTHLLRSNKQPGHESLCHLLSVRLTRGQASEAYSSTKVSISHWKAPQSFRLYTFRIPHPSILSLWGLWMEKLLLQVKGLGRQEGPGHALGPRFGEAQFSHCTPESIPSHMAARFGAVEKRLEDLHCGVADLDLLPRRRSVVGHGLDGIDDSELGLNCISMIVSFWCLDSEPGVGGVWADDR